MTKRDRTISDVVAAALAKKPRALVYDADHFDAKGHVSRTITRGDVATLLHFAAKEDRFARESDVELKWKAFGTVGPKNEAWEVVFVVLPDETLYIITAHAAVRGAS